MSHHYTAAQYVVDRSTYFFLFRMIKLEERSFPWEDSVRILSWMSSQTGKLLIILLRPTFSFFHKFPWCFRWGQFIVLSKFYSCSTAFCYLLIIWQDISVQTVAKLLARMRFVNPLCLINLIIPYLTFYVTRFRAFQINGPIFAQLKAKNFSKEYRTFKQTVFLICLRCN